MTVSIDTTKTDSQGRFIQSGTGAAAQSLQAFLRKQEVYASSFTGFDETGATDSTAAVYAAIASLPAGGGVVQIPRGTPRFNVVITKPGVTLRGAGMTQDRSWTSGSNYVRPWNDAEPAIQVGNDTGLVTGVSLQEITAYGAGTGTVGIYFAAGAFRCTTHNVSAYEFTTNNWKFKGGATWPCSLIFNYGSISQSTVAGNEGVLIDGNVATYTSAVYFNGAHLSVNGAGSHALAVDSCDSVFMSSAYVDADDLKGVVMRKSGAVDPVIYASNLTLDSNVNTDVLLEVHNTSLIPSDFIRGAWTLDGKMKNSAAATAGPFTGSGGLFAAPLLRAPQIDGKASFPDPTDAGYLTDTTAAIYATGAAGSRALELDGRSIRLNTGAAAYVRVNSPSGGSQVTLQLVDQLNSRTATVANSSGTLELSGSGSGLGVKVGDGAWNGQPMRLGNYYLWVDSSGRLRIDTSTPTSDTDGTVVGTQT
jgi:hypothetical protein